MSLLMKISAMAFLQLPAMMALADDPPRLEVPVADPGAPLTFIAYGDTRFTQRDGVANAVARRALVARMAGEKPAAIFIGGDLVYEGSSLQDCETYRAFAPRPGRGGRQPHTQLRTAHAGLEVSALQAGKAHLV